MPGARRETGARNIGYAINGANEEVKTGDVEDGLREPLLSGREGVDLGDEDNIAHKGGVRDEDAENKDGGLTKDKDGKAVAKPSSFVDLFFFADKVRH